MHRLLYILLVIIVIIIGIIMSISTLVKGGIETFGSKAIGAPVSVAFVKFSPFNFSASIHKLKVGNPQGFSSPHAMTVDKIHLKLDRGSLFSDKVIVDYIRILEPTITFEGLIGRNNISQIKRNVANYSQSSTEPTSSAPASDAKEDSKSSRKVQITELLVTAPTLNIVVKTPVGEESISETLDDIQINDIGSRRQQNPAQVVAVFVGVLNNAIQQIVVKHISGNGTLKKGVESIKDNFKSLGKSLKELF